MTCAKETTQMVNSICPILVRAPRRTAAYCGWTFEKLCIHSLIFCFPPLSSSALLPCLKDLPRPGVGPFRHSRGPDSDSTSDVASSFALSLESNRDRREGTQDAPQIFERIVLRLALLQMTMQRWALTTEN